MDIKLARQVVDDLFSKRSRFMMLCQEIAENFYPERADFTVRREIGDTFADNLMSSFPVMCRRDLGDQIGAMLRPTQKEWAHMALRDERRQDNDAKRWLEWATGVQRRAMYDPVAQFTRATKEGDHDFATFGQCVLSVELNRTANALLYRCWHIRDVVWMENHLGHISLTARKWRPYAHDLQRIFGGKNHEKVAREAAKTPFKEINCLHIIMDADMYDGDAKGRPYWSIYYDCEHETVLEAIPVWNKKYIIPRWQTVSGSQYAYSPASIVALPDARLIQAMTYTLLEAGEKIVNPPLVATQDAVRSDVAIYAGGITWVDQEYDERLGEALRPLTQDIRGMPIGIDMQRDARDMLMRAFFLNRLRPFNPSTDPDMTAYQAGQIVQDWIRQAMPLFEPMEMGYNGDVMETSFDVLMRAGAFGSAYDMPESLQGADIQFRFESPLHDAIEQQKGQKFLEAKALLMAAAELDQKVLALPDAVTAMRDALEGIKVPAKWIRSESEVEAIQQQQQDSVDTQDMLAAAKQGSEVVKNLGKAQRDIAAVGVV